MKKSIKLPGKKIYAVSKKQKLELFKEFKELLIPVMYDYAIFGAWLSHQNDDYKSHHIKSIKNRELKSEITHREKFINGHAQKRMKKALDDMRNGKIWNDLRKQARQIDKQGGLQ